MTQAIRERYSSLDLIRGLSIFGILFVNAMAFVHPFMVYSGMGETGVPVTAADRLSTWAVETFAHSKFITLFSLLFGVSVFLVGQSQPEGVKGLKSPLMRRLLWLLVFGLLHGIVIWLGDVLLLYALSGLIFMTMRHWSAGRLLLWGVLPYILLSLAMMALYALPAGDVSSDAFAEGIAQVNRLMTGSWQDSLTGNALQWVSIALMASGFYILLTVPLMMIGAGLFKSGFLKGTSPAWVYLLFVAIGALNLAVLGVINWKAHVQEDAAFAQASNLAFGAPPILVSLGYAAALILLFRTGLGKVLLFPLTCAGRMAFTNYLTQSLIMTALFYGGRFPFPEGSPVREALETHMGRDFPWYGQFNESTLMGICATLVVAQLILSTLWMQIFRYGPFEWVWRCLTQGRFVGIMK